MSQYGLIYRSEWLMANDVNIVTVNIYKTDVLIDDADTPIVNEMKGGKNPLIISVVDNERNKLNPIRSKQAKIEVLTDLNLDITTFTGGPDNLWFVEIIFDSGPVIFKGYLVTADVSQPFLPNQQVLTLTASDCLGLLKDIPLTDDAGVTPTNPQTLALFIAWCLKKTGLELDLYVVNNLRHYTTEPIPGHFYDIIFTESKTFEAEISECEDCYSVLRKILGFDCYITQYKGAWWIFRVDEYDENDIYVSIFDKDGTFLSNEAPTTYNFSIGDAETVEFATADAIIERERPLNFAKLTYRYEYPLEVPCNSDFSRGDYDSDLPDETVDGVVYSVKKYDLECWTLKRGIGPSATTPNCTAYIKRLFNDLDYEHKRYATITSPSSATSPLNYLESEGITLGIKDRFDFSTDYAWGWDAVSGSNYTQQIAAIRLEGLDSSHWTLDDDGKWYLSDASWATNFKILTETFVPNDEDERILRTKSVEAKSLPVEGTVYIMLFALNQQATGLDDTEIKFANLSFTYYPFINGTHSKYTGQYQKVNRTPVVGKKWLAKLDDQVYISDSPKKLFKGALLWVNAGYELTQRFYPHNVFPSGPPDDTYAHPYGELQIRSVWNQGVYANWILSGNIWPIGENWPDMIHKYLITDSHVATYNRYFLMTSFDQNWKTGMMNATLIEVFDRTLGKVYDDPREFKYITNG